MSYEYVECFTLFFWIINEKSLSISDHTSISVFPITGYPRIHNAMICCDLETDIVILGYQIDFLPCFCGMKIQEVNQLLRQFEMMKKSIRQMQKKSLGSKVNKSRLAAKLMKIKKERRKKKQKKRR